MKECKLSSNMFGWTACQKIKTLVYNKFPGVSVSFISESSKDTEFIYSVWVDKGISKQQRNAIEWYCIGINDAVESYK